MFVTRWRPRVRADGIIGSKLAHSSRHWDSVHLAASAPCAARPSAWQPLPDRVTGGSYGSRISKQAPGDSQWSVRPRVISLRNGFARTLRLRSTVENASHRRELRLGPPP